MARGDRTGAQRALALVHRQRRVGGQARLGGAVGPHARQARPDGGRRAGLPGPLRGRVRHQVRPGAGQAGAGTVDEAGRPDARPLAQRPRRPGPRRLLRAGVLPAPARTERGARLHPAARRPTQLHRGPERLPHPDGRWGAGAPGGGRGRVVRVQPLADQPAGRPPSRHGDGRRGPGRHDRQRGQSEPPVQRAPQHSARDSGGHLYLRRAAAAAAQGAERPRDRLSARAVCHLRPAGHSLPVVPPAPGHHEHHSVRLDRGPAGSPDARHPTRPA